MMINRIIFFIFLKIYSSRASALNCQFVPLCTGPVADHPEEMPGCSHGGGGHPELGRDPARDSTLWQVTKTGTNLKTLIALRAVLGLLSWCAICKFPYEILLEGFTNWLKFHSSHSNSFEDWAPADSIYGCPIFKWVAVTWLHGRVPG